MIRAVFRLPWSLVSVTTLAVILHTPAALPGSVIRLIDVVTPRSYGYTIGDPIRHEVRLEVDSRYTLDRAALPKPRRLNGWLWLEDVGVRERSVSNATEYTVVLAYQILSPPETVTRLFVPQQTLFLEADEERVPVTVEPWGFTAAPLTQKPDPSALPFVDLQPSITPTPLPLFSHAAIMSLSVILFCSAISLLLYVRWRLPWVARSNGPFARALRELETLRTRAPDAARYDVALRCTHRAFNDTAGSAVFADTLATFFEAHPQFRVRRDPIASFFKESGNWFFAQRSEPVPPDLKHLINLCRSCRDIERGIL